MNLMFWRLLITLLFSCSCLMASYINLLQFSKETAPSLLDETWTWSGVTVRRVKESRLSIRPDSVRCSVLLRIPNSDGRAIFKYLDSRDGHEFELPPTHLLLVCANPTTSHFDLNRALECYAYGNQEAASDILKHDNCGFFGNTASFDSRRG